MRGCHRLSILLLLAAASVAWADVGDPQVRTDHPWYPGELACSTFERLFATQAEVYERVVGRRPTTDEDKALAAWLWRNTHYAHGEEGTEDLWGQGFQKGGDLRMREYWTGMFAHGFGLCGTTHAQWCAEMEALLGHARGRAVGVSGHNSFEAFLTGGAYGEGRWALLDHDISTVIYSPDGGRLLSLGEVQPNWKRLATRAAPTGKQHGWLVCGLHPDDGGVYADYEVAEYLAGYSGLPPLVHLRRGETLRRYLQPGLADGQTFVFWGRNYKSGGIPGPERSRTWVNQPDKMHGSTKGTSHVTGQARYGNAVYVYQPDFASGDYREGVVAEDDQQVTFEFYSPYIIGATPKNDGPWGIYEPGCTGGLTLAGSGGVRVSLSVDQGLTWQPCGQLRDSLNLTDLAKGHRQYLLKLHAGAKQLAGSRLTITTVCQANPATMPRLKEGGSEVRFAASDRAVLSAGPNLKQAEAHLVEGAFGTPQVTLELQAPRGGQAVELHAAAHVQSSSPPNPEVKYAIDYSTDGGQSWHSLLQDWAISRRGEEPRDFWSQSLCWGTRELARPTAGPIRVRFRNTGSKKYPRAEAHLVYATHSPGSDTPQTNATPRDATRVTFAWRDDAGAHQQSHLFGEKSGLWQLPTGTNVTTNWVEFAVQSSAQ